MTVSSPREKTSPTGSQAPQAAQSTDTSPTAQVRYRAFDRPLWARTLFTPEFLIIGLLAAVWIAALILVPNFDGPLTVRYLLLDIAPLMMIALPMTLIIITGQIDLSVASVVGLSSVLVGVLHVQMGLSLPVAALIAVGAGVLCGAFNGFLVAYVGLPSLAVTIGTLALFRGIAVGLLGTTALTDFPEQWTSLASASIGGETRIPVVVLPILVLIAIFTLLLHFTRFGRGLYDIGHNDEAAWFSGIDVARSKMITFVLSGTVSAMAGVFHTLRFGNSRGDNAMGLELEVIAAVLLGGVLIFGGRGALHGVIAGVLLIGVISSALRLEGVTVNVINIIIGLLLIISVMTPPLAAGLRALRSSRARPTDSSTPATPRDTARPSA